MARMNLKLKTPVTDFDFDVDENSLESNGWVRIVRCGECRYGITAHGISDGGVLCSKPYTERGNAMHRDDWFCADGERKVQE